MQENEEMRLEAWVGSDLGQVRKRNEDNYLVDALNGIFVVADGMGGGVEGEKASRLAIEAYTASLYNHLHIIRQLSPHSEQSLRDEIAGILHKAMRAANNEIVAIRKAMPPNTQMGTTLSSLIIVGAMGVLAHAGDSRIYRVRYRELRTFTLDHSLAAEQVRDGYITPEEASRSPFRNILLHAIGIHDDITPQIDFFSIEPGDQFLLCSDGLHSYLTDDEVIAVLNESVGSRIVPRLIDCANARGGHDNITAIAIRVSSPERHDTTQLDVGQDIFSHSPLLRGLKPAETGKLLQIGKMHDFISGELIVSEDDPGRSLFLIFTGKVALYRQGIWLGTMEDGQHFGTYGLVDGQGRITSAVAQSQVRVLEIPHKPFLEILRGESSFGVKILWNMLKDLSGAHRDLVARLIHSPQDTQRS